MGWTDWLVIAAAAACAAFGWRFGFAAAWRGDVGSDTGTWGDVLWCGLFIGPICAAISPGIIIYLLLSNTVGRRDANAVGRFIAGASKEERDLRRRERAIEIARQEQELGIGVHQ